MELVCLSSNLDSITYCWVTVLCVFPSIKWVYIIIPISLLHLAHTRLYQLLLRSINPLFIILKNYKFLIKIFKDSFYITHLTIKPDLMNVFVAYSLFLVPYLTLSYLYLVGKNLLYNTDIQYYYFILLGSLS